MSDELWGSTPSETSPHISCATQHCTSSWPRLSVTHTDERKSTSSDGACPPERRPLASPTPTVWPTLRSSLWIWSTSCLMSDLYL